MAKKSIDLNTFRGGRYAPKEPVFTSREQIALDNADRVITRMIINGEWKSKEWFPENGQSVRDCLAGIQSQLRHSPDIRGVVLYVGGASPETGGLMLAAMPHECVPASLKR